MKHKPLTIQIPEPEKSGYCNRTCPFLVISFPYTECTRNLAEIEQTIISSGEEMGMKFTKAKLCKPGKGCPWQKR